MITPIAQEHIAAVWPQAEPLLARPLAVLAERTTHDLLIALVTGREYLWHLTGDGADAWVVTEIHDYPRKRVAHLNLCAGHLGNGSIAEMREAFVAWGREHGAAELRMRGRKGWERLLPEASITLLYRLGLGSVVESHIPIENALHD